MLYDIAKRLVAFVKEYDPYSYQECLAPGETDKDVIAHAATDLASSDYFNSVCSYLSEIDDTKLDTELVREKIAIQDMLSAYAANVAYTEYAVEINNDKGFVRQMDVFDSYKAAEDFVNKYDKPLDSDEYLNIIFIDYDEHGNEIEFGTVC